MDAERIKSIQIFVFTCALMMPLFSAGQKRMTREDYIKAYSGFAVDEMNRSGVPASITLAQGILESDCGNSTLARKANNHFGIKCHKNWEGKKVYHDDDAPNECFRSYSSVRESYRDHSDFLKNSARYAFLFKLKPSDYKGWARGLQKAGYATDPRYADLLIRIIEEGYFHQNDVALIPKKGKRNEAVKTTVKVEPEQQAEESEFTVDIESRRIFTRNRVEYVVAKNGDTYETITRDMNLMPWDIAHFNEMSKGDPIQEGDPVYLGPKKGRAERGFNVHVVQQGENMHAISQKYAIRLSKLYKRNRMAEGTEPAAGEKIWLRKNIKDSGAVRLRTQDS
ncbi:MAG: glucosaminidase domain-containing protein [Bacteroidales bacterium]